MVCELKLAMSQSHHRVCGYLMAVASATWISLPCCDDCHCGSSTAYLLDTVSTYLITDPHVWSSYQYPPAGEAVGSWPRSSIVSHWTCISGEVDPDGHGYTLLNLSSSHTTLPSTRHGSMCRTNQNGVSSWRRLCSAEGAPPDAADEENNWDNDTFSELRSCSLATDVHGIPK